MALTASQYRDKAETAANQAVNSTSEAKLAASTLASVWSFLYVEQTKIDKGFYDTPPA